MKVWGLHKHLHLSTLLPQTLWILPVFSEVELTYAFMFNEEHREVQRITLCPDKTAVFRTQRLLLLLWSAMFRCIFKNKTDTELCLAPEGTAVSFCQTASSVLQGVGSLVSAPIQIFKWKECKRRDRREKGGRECRDTRRKQVKNWRQRERGGERKKSKPSLQKEMSKQRDRRR